MRIERTKTRVRAFLTLVMVLLMAGSAKAALLDPASLLARASTAGYGDSVQDAVNGAGMTGNLHNDFYGDMWYPINVTTISDHWYKVNLGQSYNLNSVSVWNFNRPGELNAGANEVDIYYATEDPLTNIQNTTPFNTGGWTSWGTVNLTQSPGGTAIAATDTINLNGMNAKYIAFDIRSNHGHPDRLGLSELQFDGQPGALALPTPISATGWNEDMIFEDTASPTYTATGGSSMNLYEATTSLPADGSIEMPWTNTVFQMQHYTASNTLNIPSVGSTGTLTLDTARPYSKLSILGAGGSLNSHGEGSNNSILVTINGDPTMTLTFALPNQVNGNNNVLDSFFNTRMKTLDGSIDQDRDLFEVQLDLEAAGFSTVLIETLTFQTLSIGSNGGPAIYAISGIEIPEPATALMLLAGLLGVTLRRRKR